MTRKGKSVIRETLNRIKWHEKPDRYIIRILHRSLDGEIGFIEIRASDIDEIGSWYIRLGGTIIPFHRIVEIRRTNGEIVWRKGYRDATF